MGGGGARPPRPPPGYAPAFTSAEITDAIQTMKVNRSGGPSGIPPGLLKALPAKWILFLASVFSTVLCTASYPGSWAVSRLIVIFKNGSRLVCDNYRGIADMDTFGKLFDLLLCRRLERWFRPDREQAGAQKGRGCIGHILRLLIDYAKSTHTPLYIAYIDFSKEYDKVPLNALFRVMLRLGCGYLMLSAVMCLYEDTKMVLGAAMITTTIGLHQGSPTSCFLFTMYSNEFVKDLKCICQPDGYLGGLHCLLLMDDTILLATSRERCIEKLSILCEFCSRSGMVINASKTKFMVINGNVKDREPLVYGNIVVQNWDSYIYLGAVFTQDGSTETSVSEHLLSKHPHVLKFNAFITTNVDFPFWIKQKVFHAALLSTILYSSEAWLGNSARNAQTAYYSVVKTLRGVRVTTANELCLMELGIPSVVTRVRDAQKKFLDKLLKERQTYEDDLFMKVSRLCSTTRTPGFFVFEKCAGRR